MDNTTKTRSQIIAAAIQLFDRFGPQKTTMSDVANKAGLARATVYLHFPNKRALYEASLTQGVDEMVNAVEALLLEPV